MLKQLEELSAALHEQRQDDKGVTPRGNMLMRSMFPLNKSESKSRAGQRLTEIVVSDLKKRRHLGESCSVLAADLNQLGLRGPNGARCYTASVARVLRTDR